MRSGETDQGYAIKSEQFRDWALKLGNSLGHIGPLDVDFFIKDDKPYILELNPKFGGAYPIAHLSGINFPKLLIDLARDDLKPSDYALHKEYEEGNVMVKDMSILNFK
jgi:carbamoyl-phosphate synthase large subunit